MDKIAVLGAGSWGTALAIVLADNQHDVHIWARRPDQANEINQHHTNEKYLPDIQLPTNLKANANISEVVDGTDTIVLVTPTKAIRETIKQLRENVSSPVTIVHAAKGIEPDTLMRVSQVITEEMPANLLKSIVVLSGPSHAEEVSLRKPTTVTVASNDRSEAEKIQDLFINANFRVYTNEDVIGVELGGALKNIIALGAGLSDGLGYGDNAKAALLTRGLAEITRLGTYMGANPLTFAGLTGLGDLVATCTSVHSRNWRAGNMLGQGNKLDDVLENMGMVVEGVRTTKAAYQLAKRESVDMPITQELFEVLFEDKKPKEAVDCLMMRTRTDEVEQLGNIIQNKDN